MVFESFMLFGSTGNVETFLPNHLHYHIIIIRGMGGCCIISMYYALHRQ